MTATTTTPAHIYNKTKDKNTNEIINRKHEKQQQKNNKIKTKRNNKQEVLQD